MIGDGCLSIGLTQFDGVVDVEKTASPGDYDASIGGIFRDDVAERDFYRANLHAHCEVRSLSYGSHGFFARARYRRVPFDQFPHIADIEKTVLGGSRHSNRLGNV